MFNRSKQPSRQSIGSIVSLMIILAEGALLLVGYNGIVGQYRMAIGYVFGLMIVTNLAIGKNPPAVVVVRQINPLTEFGVRMRLITILSGLLALELLQGFIPTLFQTFPVTIVAAIGMFNCITIMRGPINVWNSPVVWVTVLTLFVLCCIIPISWLAFGVWLWTCIVFTNRHISGWRVTYIHLWLALQIGICIAVYYLARRFGL